MPATNERLARSLKELQQLQQDGSRVFASNQLSRATRERLVKNGFLLEVMKGWLVSSSPSAAPGDTSPWFSSFWEFCSRYCNERFGDSWYLSPEQSLLIHAENTVIPKQVFIQSPGANNSRVELLFGTSFFALKTSATPPPQDVTVLNGLRIYRIPAALVRVTESFFQMHPLEAAIVLGAIRDTSELLSHLLAGAHSTVAGRLAGALRELGRNDLADDIVGAMKAADHEVRESNPFKAQTPTAPQLKIAPPIVSRLHALWESGRGAVMHAFASFDRKTVKPADYMKAIDDVYKLDAYHSLSIEGYQVTPELIQRVATGEWDPKLSSTDREHRNALAARGYWLAFSRVRNLVERSLTEDSAPNVRMGHRDWYREMFSPYVAAGLLPATALAGYRNVAVYIRGSRHVPPRWELLADAMSAYFDLIEREPDPAARAVLGHWLFGYVHPYPDGNGRIARLLMNALLAHGGYPWTVIRSDERNAYLAALEAASVDTNLTPFAKFVRAQMTKTARRQPRRSRR